MNQSVISFFVLVITFKMLCSVCCLYYILKLFFFIGMIICL